MDLANNNFVEDESITNLNDQYSYYYSFLEDYTNSYPKFTNEEKNLFLNSVENNMNLIHYNNVVGIINNTILVDNPIEGKQTTLNKLIIDLKNNNLISNSELIKINT